MMYQVKLIGQLATTSADTNDYHLGIPLIAIFLYMIDRSLMALDITSCQQTCST